MRLVACDEAPTEVLVARPKERSSEPLYLCVTSEYRVTMLSKAPKRVGSTKTPPLKPVVFAPCTHPSTVISQLLPGKVFHYTPAELAEVVTSVPCFWAVPTTCVCKKPGTDFVYGYPSADGKCDENCRPVDWRDYLAVYAMPPVVRGFKVYRYMVTIGPSRVFIAPLAVFEATARLFERAVSSGLVPWDHVKAVLEKYDNKTPSVEKLFANALRVDASVLGGVENVPPAFHVDRGKYVDVDFKPELMGFNIYRVKGGLWHSVLYAWFDSDAVAYAVSRVLWEMKKDIYNPLYATRGWVRRSLARIESRALHERVGERLAIHRILSER